VGLNLLCGFFVSNSDIGKPPPTSWPCAKNASPWLDEQATMRKEKNFFETRVIEYQTGAQLEW